MQPKVGHEVGDIVLTSIFISLAIILISRLSLSYPLEKLQRGTQNQPSNTLNPQQSDSEIDYFTESNEVENSSLSKRTTTLQHLQGKIIENKAHTYKCEFVGNVGLKNHCVRFLICTKVGAVGVPRHCTSGKHFDFVKRLCINKKDAECDSAKVCPDDLTVYRVGISYLQCRDGVPYPKKYPTCPANMAFDQKMNKCASKQGNTQTQVVQVNAYPVGNGTGIQVQVTKPGSNDMGAQLSNLAGNQQQMSGGYATKQDLGPSQNMGQNQNIQPMTTIQVGLSPNLNGGASPSSPIQNVVTMTNQNQNIPNQNMGNTQNQNTGSLQNQNVGNMGNQNMQPMATVQVGLSPNPNLDTTQNQNMGTMQNPNMDTMQNQNMGSMPNQNMYNMPNQTQTQVFQVSSYQNEEGKMKVQVNESKIQNTATQNSNSAGNQEQIHWDPILKQNVVIYTNQNVDAYPNQNVDMYPSQNVKTYPNQNVGTLPNENVNTYPNQNVDTYPNQNVGTSPIENVNTYPNQNVNTYRNGRSFQNANAGIYSNHNVGPSPNKNVDAFLNQNRRPRSNPNMGPMSNQNVETYPNQTSTQGTQGNTYQKRDGKTKRQVNDCVNQDTTTQKNSASNQEQIRWDPVSKQNVVANPNRNRRACQNETVVTYPNQNVDTYSNQNTGTFPNQNGRAFQNQNAQPSPNQDKTPGLQVRTYQNGREMKVVINETMVKDTDTKPFSTSTGGRQPQRSNNQNAQKQAGQQSNVRTIVNVGIQVSTTPEPSLNNSTNKTPNFGLTWNHGIPTGAEISMNLNQSAVPVAKTTLSNLSPFSSHHLDHPNQNMGAYNNQNAPTTNTQTQVKVSTSQKENGKQINLQINQTVVPAGPQQQINPAPNQNGGTTPNQNMGPTPDQNMTIIVDPSPNQNERPWPQQQHIGILPKENEVTLEFHRGDPIPNRNASHLSKPKPRPRPKPNPSTKQFSYRVQYSLPVKFANVFPISPIDNTGLPQVKVKVVHVEADKAKVNERDIKQNEPELLIGEKNRNQTEKNELSKFIEIPEDGEVFDNINNNARERSEFKGNRAVTKDGGGSQEEESTTMKIRHLRHKRFH